MTIVSRVQGANEAAGQYLIEWKCNGKQKWVSKLNILFEGDEETTLAERYQKAVENRFDS